MAAPKFAVDIRTYLVSTTGLSPVSIGFLTPDPIIQYAVIEYPGPQSVKTHGGSAPRVKLDEGNIQVAARHTSAQSALTNIMTVVDALDGLTATIGSVTYTDVCLKGRPRILDRAEDGSCIYIAEFNVQCRR